MQLADLQAAATRTWRAHLVRCAIITAALISVPLVQHLQLRFLDTGYAFTRFGWLVSALLAVYLAEWTWHERRQLQVIRNLRSLPADSELVLSRAKEKAHRSLASFVLVSALYFLTLLMTAHTPLSRSLGSILWVVPVSALAALVRSWHEQRLATPAAH
jgi:hypothetical protein